MNRARRHFLRWTASLAALPALPHGATAETFPSRPVKIIVGLPAGGAPDIYARLVADCVLGRDPGEDIASCSPRRFANS